MKRGATGTYASTAFGGEQVRAFVPRPLPPDPPIEADGEFQLLMERALLALGRLDGLSSLLPDTDLLLYSYVRKEAVLSSQIEGTQSSLSDLLLFEFEESPGAPLDDVMEVSNYVGALDHGLHDGVRVLPARCRHPTARAAQGGPGACPVRDHPSVS